MERGDRCPGLYIFTDWANGLGLDVVLKERKRKDGQMTPAEKELIEKVNRRIDEMTKSFEVYPSEAPAKSLARYFGKMTDILIEEGVLKPTIVKVLETISDPKNRP